MSDEDRFHVDESAALLREIFPDYPDLRGCRPVPDLRNFLAEIRAKRKSPGETESCDGTLDP
jgi:hypothetical protein